MNGRLEIVFLKHREKLGAVTNVRQQILQIQDQNQKDAQQLKDALDAQISELREDYDHSQSIQKSLEDEIKLLRAKKSDLLLDIKDDQKTRFEFERMYKKNSNDFVKENSKNLDLRNQVFMLNQSCSSLEDTLKTAQEEVDTLIEGLERDREDLSNLDDSIDYFERKQKEYKSQFEKESKILQKELHLVRKTKDGIEGSLRREFNEELVNILAQRKELYCEERETILEKIRTTSESRLQDLRMSADSMSSDIQIYEEKHGEIDREIKFTQERITESIQLNNILSSRIGELKNTIIQYKQGPSITIERLEDTLKTLKREYHSKTVSQVELHDLNVKIARELDQYKVMLEAEEDRLHLHAPKSRKVQGKFDVSVSLPISANYDPSNSSASSFSIEIMDAGCREIRIVNKSIEAKRLADWRLETQKGGLDLIFPDDCIVAEEDFVTVWLGDEEEYVGDDEDCIFSPSGEIDSQGDKLMLLTPQSEIADVFDIKSVQRTPSCSIQ